MCGSSPCRRRSVKTGWQCIVMRVYQLVRGQFIMDASIDWEPPEKLLREAREAMK
jgi:3-deoxy-D-arabino-heptulosonate 7-phosphate (DAHP) synthase